MIKRFLLALAGLLLLALGMLVYLVATLTEEDYAHAVQRALQDTFGPNLETRGRFFVSWSLHPHLYGEAVTLTVQEDGKEVVLAEAEDFGLTLNLPELLARRVLLEMKIERGTVYLGSDPQGGSHWRTLVRDWEAQPKRRGTERIPVLIEALHLTDMELRNGDARGHLGYVTRIGDLVVRRDDDRLVARITSEIPYQGIRLRVEGTLTGAQTGDALNADLEGTLLAPEDVPNSKRPNRKPKAPDLTGRVGVKGRISDLFGSPEGNFQIAAEVSDLAALGRVAGLLPEQWADSGPASATTQVRVASGGIDLVGAKLDLPRLGLAVSGAGTLTIAQDGTPAELNLDVTARDLGGVAAYLGIPHPWREESGEARLSGRLNGEGGTWRLSGLKAAGDPPGGHWTVSGGIDGIQRKEAPRLDLDVKLQMDRLGSLSRHMSVVPERLPDVGPIAIETRLVGRPNAFLLDPMRVRLTDPHGKLDLKGKVRGLPRKPKANLSANLAADSLASLDRVLDMRLPDAGPVRGSATLELEPGHYSASALDLTVGDSDLSGTFSLATGTQPPTVEAELRSRRFTLSPFLPQGTEPEAEPAAKAKGSPALFSRQPIDLAWLGTVQGRLRFHADRLELKDHKLSHLDLRAALQQKRLDVEQADFGVAGGEVGLRGRLDASGEPIRFSVVQTLDGVELSRTPEVPAGMLEGGKTSGEIALEGSGSSAHEWVGDLSGQVLLEIGSTRVKDARSDWVSGGLVMQLLRGLLSPLRASSAQGDRSVEYQCGAIGAYVEKGVMVSPAGLAFVSKEFNLTGGGKVDLKDETLDLHLLPVSKTGIGLSLGDLVGGFRLSGPLGDPTVGLSGKGLMESAVVGAVVTPLVRGLVNRIVGNLQDPCKAALDRTRAEIAGLKGQPAPSGD